MLQYALISTAASKTSCCAATWHRHLGRLLHHKTTTSGYSAKIPFSGRALNNLFGIGAVRGPRPRVLWGFLQVAHHGIWRSRGDLHSEFMAHSATIHLPQGVPGKTSMLGSSSIVGRDASCVGPDNGHLDVPSV
jgi:hypothetical protein